MELIHQLQGTWRFIFEDALLDDRTPIWRFSGATVTEISPRHATGRCEISNENVRIIFPGQHGEVVVTLQMASVQATGAAAIVGSYEEPFANFKLNTFCTLVRMPPGPNDGEPAIANDEALALAA